MTVRESSRIRLPDRFVAGKADGDRFPPNGTAVPPILGEAAASALRQHRWQKSDKCG